MASVAVGEQNSELLQDLLLVAYAGGLVGQSAIEKRRIYGSAPHARWAAEEVGQWPVTSDQAAGGDYPPELPIAVVTAATGRIIPKRAPTPTQRMARP